MNTKKLLLASSIFNIIIGMIEQGEDWSLLQRTYNGLIEEHNLPLPQIRWISLKEYELIK